MGGHVVLGVLARCLIGAIGLIAAATAAGAAEPVDIAIGYLGRAGVPQTLSARPAGAR